MSRCGNVRWENRDATNADLRQKTVVKRVKAGFPAVRRPHRDLQRRLTAHIELEILLALCYNWLLYPVYE